MNLDLGKSEALEESVDNENTLKGWLVNYTGKKLNKNDGENITVENIVEIMSLEFPEFLLAIAEENWVRGYHQALNDVDEGRELMESEENEQKN
tara:strand:+ start:103 stop:384 length:282 start_codon:yes stop_codon:yes gene_type:complete